MTTEEKAKAYDEALEVARKELGVDRKEWEVVEHVLRNIFPELRESEDEKARKGLINFLNQQEISNRITFEAKQSWLAWLEKQKINTEGDFGRGYDCGYEACLNSHGAEWLEKQKEEEGYEAIPVESTLEYKLGFKAGKEPEKQEEQKPKHFDLKAGKWYICHRAFCCRADHLTVKEGERFMCEKDGVVKGFVVKEPEKYFKECSAPEPMEDEQKEQKPAWSEEDEKMLARIIERGQSQIQMFETGLLPEHIAWLKSLRPSWKPTEEHFQGLRRAILKADTGSDTERTLKELYEQLKKL